MVDKLKRIAAIKKEIQKHQHFINSMFNESFSLLGLEKDEINKHTDSLHDYLLNDGSFELIKDLISD